MSISASTKIYSEIISNIRIAFFKLEFLVSQPYAGGAFCSFPHVVPLRGRRHRPLFCWLKTCIGQRVLSVDSVPPRFSSAVYLHSVFASYLWLKPCLFQIPMRMIMETNPSKHASLLGFSSNSRILHFVTVHPLCLLFMSSSLLNFIWSIDSKLVTRP